MVREPLWLLRCRPLVVREPPLALAIGPTSAGSDTRLASYGATGGCRPAGVAQPSCPKWFPSLPVAHASASPAAQWPASASIFFSLLCRRSSPAQLSSACPWARVASPRWGLSACQRLARSRRHGDAVGEPASTTGSRAPTVIRASTDRARRRTGLPGVQAGRGVQLGSRFGSQFGSRRARQAGGASNLGSEGGAGSGRAPYRRESSKATVPSCIREYTLPLASVEVEADSSGPSERRAAMLAASGGGGIGSGGGRGFLLAPGLASGLCVAAELVMELAAEPAASEPAAGLTTELAAGAANSRRHSASCSRLK